MPVNNKLGVPYLKNNNKSQKDIEKCSRRSKNNKCTRVESISLEQGEVETIIMTLKTHKQY